MTPTNVAPTAERALELGLVVHLDERVESELGSQVVEAGELLVGERGGDEQHRVGAHQARVADISLPDGEVLAKHGNIDCGPGASEVVGRPAEVVSVGEDREARGPALLVGLRQQRRVEISGASAPFEGERRLISAMTDRPSGWSARANPRLGPARRAASVNARRSRSSRAADARCAATISSR